VVLTRHKIENLMEEKIITYLIVSNEFCRDIIPIIKLEYFQVSYIGKIVSWIVDYYNIHEKAPNVSIQDIFEFEKNNLDQSEADLIAIFLNKLSEKYLEEEKLNLDYYLSKTKTYFKKRVLRLIAEKIIILTDRDMTEEAEDEIIGYKKFASDVSEWVSVYGDKEFRRKVLAPERQITRELFRFPGRLGELLGTFKRKQVICILGVFKKVKSWMLQEFASFGSKERCKVAYFSFEMDRMFFDEFKLPEPKYRLNVGSRALIGHGAQTGAMISEIETILLQEMPDVVIVQGDTNSVLAGALSAAKIPKTKNGKTSFFNTLPYS